MKQGSTGHGNQNPKQNKQWRLEGAGFVEFKGLCGQLIDEKRVGVFGVQKAFLRKIPFPVWKILIGQFIIIASIETPDRGAFVYTALSPMFDAQSVFDLKKPVPNYKLHIELNDEYKTVRLTVEKVIQNKIIKPY